MYYAVPYLETDRDLSGFMGPQFSREDLYPHIRMLHPDGIDHVPEIGIVHTIGCAYHMLGEIAETSRAADRLVF